MEERTDKVSIRIAASLLISVILVLISIIGLFSRSNALRHNYTSNLEGFKKQVKYAQGIAISSSNVQRYSSNLLNLSDKSEIVSMKAKLEKNKKRMELDLKELKNFKD